MMSGCNVSGNSSYASGGLKNNGTATLTNCTVSGNVATSTVFGGGGINNYGTATLSGCTISGNAATYGAGVGNAYGGTATLSDCTISDNSSSGAGGGLMDYDNATSTLTDCTIINNSAAGLGVDGIRIDGGGGVWNGDGSEVTLTNCTINNNSASDPVAVNVNGGGGVLNFEGVATLTDCTISGNTATGTAGYYNGGGGFCNSGFSYATLTDCTISGNSSSTAGGGVLNGGYGSYAALTDCTISGNSAVTGGGIANTSTGYYAVVNVGNTIVAVNTASTSGPDAQGTMASLGNNLIGKTDGSSGWVSSDLTGTMAAPLNPLLAPLGNYGGPTQTMYLLPGSPALDAGSNALIPTGVTTDQRGLPRIFNGTVDIGAVEDQGSGAMVFGNALYLVGGNTNDQTHRHADRHKPDREYRRPRHRPAQ